MHPERPLDSLLRRHLSRRSLLAGSLAFFGVRQVRTYAAVPRWALRFQGTPFALGIASGDPTPDGVVLWTRLAPDPLNGGGMPPAPVPVTWRIARDERLADVVQTGSITARPESAHAVHVEVDGLDPDRWYWYQFESGSEVSPVGRTRTLPRPGATPDACRFAFASCQHYETGYYTAYHHMAGEDVDLVFHLGDYIYEGAGRDDQVRRHAGAEILLLEDYRTRYAQYKTDADLQAAHAAFPWFVTWDDHEVDNNYANDVSEHDDQRDEFLIRRAIAYQAYYEHQPLRRTAMPRGPALQLYRQFRWGDLAAFFVLDTRQYRTDQPCGDGSKAPCEGVSDPAATLLGADQERWLFDALDQSRARWHVLPQQVMMAKVDLTPGDAERYSMDQWSGYDVARTRLLDFLGTRKPANPVVLTGDIHSNWVNDLKVDFKDPASPAVATEFVGTSITSGGDGSDNARRAATLMAENPFVRWHNGQRGYVRCDVGRASLDAYYRVVPFVSKPGAPLTTPASFVVEDGRPGAVRR
ncbi:MAG: alkaline phosphatase D family protein [Vicinamibacterales bacterium]